VSFSDILSQLGGGLGTAGAAVAGWVATQIREVKAAAEKAEAARAFVEAALARFRSELEALDTLKRGIKLEIENAQQHPYRGSSPFLPEPGAPSNGELGRRLDEVTRRLEELKSDITRERGARHALQAQLTADSREEERQWRETHQALGEIKAYFRLLPPPR
jgi:predicted  nucleic acid-binding Zn-ribbon protein